MKVSLLTDAPKHNLALMKISACHKEQGDEVTLNLPLWKADKTYASVLFEWNKNKFIADEYGGIAYVDRSRQHGKPFWNGNLRSDVDSILPDYDLFGIDYSLGYTFRPCIRGCNFCKVKSIIHPDQNHHSIFDFHNTRFTKICLLNNNTFFDPQWRETFLEIWDADLTVIDENGYDLRLIDEEKAQSLKRTKWDNGHDPHFAWDRMRDEKEIIIGLGEVNRAGMKLKSIYVLIGYDTTIEEDIYRCQKIHDMGHDPFPMIYENGEPNRTLHSFRRMIYQRYYRKEGNIEKAWRDYNK